MNGNSNGRVHLPLYYEPKVPEPEPVVVERPPAPKVRADCLEGGVNEGRPCPWVGCFYNIVESDPDPKAKAPTCVLDMADEGGVTLEEVGRVMGITRERVRQIEAKALRRLKAKDVIAFRGNLAKHLEE
jgi:hypothetical protein